MAKFAYYARPMSIYNTAQETRDCAEIEKLGYVPIQINKKEIQERVAIDGMEVFLPLVRQADVLFFRSFYGGSIGAGVAKEIAWAVESGIPVFEFPQSIGRRTLSVDQTRQALSELGQR